MIKVNKDFNNIPNVLKNKKREDAFNQNIEAKKFTYGKTLYKADKVKQRLSKIYHNKCAYCEKDISDDPQHIEHYRPKDIYYWLAYSWDNLLLCCSRCNSAKSNKFEVKNSKVQYNNENYKDVHNLGTRYDDTENPMFINPEKDDILKYILFNTNGTISSSNDRVQYTIDNCNLNRDALVQNRVQILNDFKNILKKYLFLAKLNNDKSIIKPILKDFISKCKVENEYFAFREYIVKNLMEIIK